MKRRMIAALGRCLIRRVADRRAPDFIIGGEDDPYLRRWWVIPRNRFFNIYLHHFMRSDDDRALHDHPWVNLSVLLTNEYIEHMPGGLEKIRRAGDMVLRWPSAAHRVELFEARYVDGTPDWRDDPVWTLFITGPRVRQWGFLCPQGWRHWKDFTAGKNGERVGRGCD
jgi:hypothetical protein